MEKLDICNLALNHLGMNSLTVLTTGNPSADAIDAFYQTAIDDIFREFKWPFATVRALLADASTYATAPIGWDYIYTYPANAATVWSVFDEGSVDTKEQQEFEVMLSEDSTTAKKLICTNLSPAYSEYTFKTADTTLYDPKFCLALSYKLAACMAHTLIGSAEKGLKLMEIYSMVLSEAKRTSGVEKLKKPVQTSSYQNSRG